MKEFKPTKRYKELEAELESFAHIKVSDQLPKGKFVELLDRKFEIHDEMNRIYVAQTT